MAGTISRLRGPHPRTALVALSLMAACDGGALLAPTDELGDIEGLAELAQPLTPLATPCTFAAISGVLTLTVAVADNETALISRRSVDSALLVNGAQCGTATALNAKRVVVTGSSGKNIVIVDYMNGTFTPGYGSTAGLTVDLVSGSGDALRFRGSTQADTLTIGANGIAINADTVLDATFANVDELTFSLGAGADVFSGSGGYGTGGASTAALSVFGGDGNDNLTGGAAADTLRGGAGADTLRGSADGVSDTAADSLYGGAGDDLFDAGTSDGGSNTFYGEAGTDHLTYATRTGPITAYLGVYVSRPGGSDTIDNQLEILTGTSANDEFQFDPNAGTYTVNGGPGDDFFAHQGGGGGTAGGHTFVGGAGIDGVSYYWVEVGDVVVSIDNVANDGTTGLDNVKTDIEKVWGGQGNDVLTGSAGNDILDGVQGNDILNGLAGDDTFAEADGFGTDIYNGGAGSDTMDMSTRTADQSITLDGVANDGAAGELDNVGADMEVIRTGSGDDVIVGNANANDLDGGDGADQLVGGAGNDILYGGAGVDDLDGGEGDDVIDGGEGTDTPLTCGSGDGDIVVLGASESALQCEL